MAASGATSSSRSASSEKGKLILSTIFSRSSDPSHLITFLGHLLTDINKTTPQPTLWLLIESRKDGCITVHRRRFIKGELQPYDSNEDSFRYALVKSEDPSLAPLWKIVGYNKETNADNYAALLSEDKLILMSKSSAQKLPEYANALLATLEKGGFNFDHYSKPTLQTKARENVYGGIRECGYTVFETMPNETLSELEEKLRGDDVCPITHESLPDISKLAITPGGKCFSAEELQEWAETRGTDPLTLAPLPASSLLFTTRGGSALQAALTRVEAEKARRILKTSAG